MTDLFTAAAMAFLDEVMPEAEPWTYEAARKWATESNMLEARAFRAAMAAIDITP